MSMANFSCVRADTTYNVSTLIVVIENCYRCCARLGLELYLSSEEEGFLMSQLRICRRCVYGAFLSDSVASVFDTILDAPSGLRFESYPLEGISSTPWPSEVCDVCDVPSVLCFELSSGSRFWISVLKLTLLNPTSLPSCSWCGVLLYLPVITYLTYITLHAGYYGRPFTITIICVLIGMGQHSWRL